MDKVFCRVRSTKDIALASSFFIAGCILLVIPTYDSVNILGFMMTLTGIILALALRSGYKDSENGENYCKRERYFPHSYKQDIAESLEKELFKIDLSEEDKGNGIRLDIYYNRKNGKAYVQLYEYIPYTYEPCSQVYEYQLPMIERIIK